MELKQRLTAIKNNLTSILGAVNTQLVNKGASAVTEFDDVATAIGTIPTGITPTGQIAITQNGTYDVIAFSSASVAVNSYIRKVTVTLEPLTTDKNEIVFQNPVGEEPKAVEIKSLTAAADRKMGEIYYANSFKHSGGKAQCKNLITGNTSLVGIDYGSTNIYGSIRYDASSIYIYRIISNSIYPIDTTYQCTMYFWDEEAEE